MKKEDALKANAKDISIYSTLQSLQRRKVYTMSGGLHSQRFRNVPLLLTHFLRGGLRFKVLANRPLREPGYSDMGQFLGTEFTVPYQWISEGARFTEHSDADMLKYMSCGTKHIREPLSGTVSRELIPGYKSRRRKLSLSDFFRRP